MRSAPAEGYDFGNKRQYRRDVWGIFRDLCPVPRGEADCLLMPSSEGDEIGVALSKGFREDRLHLVDRNPAIVATIKRLIAPRAETYGVDLERAASRLRCETLAMANLDLCGPVSPSLCATVENFSATAPFRHESLIAVTVMRGREDRQTMQYLRDAASPGSALAYIDAIGDPCRLHNVEIGLVDLGRLVALLHAMSGAGRWMPELVRWGAYGSNRVTMMWCVARLCDAGELERAKERVSKLIVAEELRRRRNRCDIEDRVWARCQKSPMAQRMRVISAINYTISQFHAGAVPRHMYSASETT